MIGGLAVFIHVEEANPELSSLTRDVDLLVRRSDLEAIKAAGPKYGFRVVHAAGVVPAPEIEPVRKNVPAKR